MMTPDEQIQEVLDRDAGWELRGKWLYLDSPTSPGLQVVAYCQSNDMWWRGHVPEGGTPCSPTWRSQLLSASAAADDGEEFARVTAEAQA